MLAESPAGSNTRGIPKFARPRLYAAYWSLLSLVFLLVVLATVMMINWRFVAQRSRAANGHHRTSSSAPRGNAE